MEENTSEEPRAEADLAKPEMKASVSTGDSNGASLDVKSGRQVKEWLPWVVAGVMTVVALVAVVYAVQASSPDGWKAGPTALTGQDDGGGTVSGTGASGSGGEGTAASGGSSSSGGSPSGSAPSASQPGDAPPVAKAGSKLTTITVPPLHTVGLLKIPDGVKSASYTVVFTPYGWGPGGSERGNLVVAVKSSSPAGGDVDKLIDLTGKNASFWAAPAVASAIKVGGSYSGKVNVRIEGDTGRLMLVSAEPSKS